MSNFQTFAIKFDFMDIDIEREIKEKLSNWKSIIEEYQVPSSKKAIIQLLNTFLPFILLWVLMYISYSYSKWLTIGLAFVNAFFLVRIFIIQHDCGHQSFTASKRLNNVIGTFCSLFSSIPYKYWAKIHNHHHGHTGQLEERDIGDINFLTVQEFKNRGKWGRFRYRLFRHPLTLFVIVPIVYFTVSNRIPKIKDFKGMVARIKWSQFKNNILIVFTYCLLGYFLGWKPFFFTQLSIVFIFSIIAFWFFYIQHTHETTYHNWKENWDFLIASIRGASYYKLPKLFQWLTGNIGFHHVHHLSSRIPNYNLEKCVKDNPILNRYTNIITFKESLKSMHAKLWDEQRKRLISFKEFYYLERLGVIG